MLELPIKEPWFSMIRSREKKEEYREIAPYWRRRFQNLGLLDMQGRPTGNIAVVCLRNGYGSARPKYYVAVRLEIRTGVPAWGAVPNREYYVLILYHTMGELVAAMQQGREAQRDG